MTRPGVLGWRLESPRPEVQTFGNVKAALAYERSVMWEVLTIAMLSSVISNSQIFLCTLRIRRSHDERSRTKPFSKVKG